MAAALERLRAQDCGGPLTVSVAPSFAAKWLVPRLERFQELCPEIDVRVSATMQLVDFARDDVDLAIRYGTGRWPGAQAELLLPTEAFPVCAPALLDGPRPPKDAAGPPASRPAARRQRRTVHPQLSRLGDVAAGGRR